MKMTHAELVEAGTQDILGRLRKLGLLLKRRTFTPIVDAIQALREAGVSAKDAVLLVEAIEHERRFLDGSGALRVELPVAVDRALFMLMEITGDGQTDIGQLIMLFMP